jgi:hypothetical protein
MSLEPPSLRFAGQVSRGGASRQEPSHARGEAPQAAYGPRGWRKRQCPPHHLLRMPPHTVSCVEPYCACLAACLGGAGSHATATWGSLLRHECSFPCRAIPCRACLVTCLPMLPWCHEPDRGGCAAVLGSHGGGQRLHPSRLLLWPVHLPLQRPAVGWPGVCHCHPGNGTLRGHPPTCQYMYGLDLASQGLRLRSLGSSVSACDM